jgi:S-adenosylmethionine:tRNA ribosyltransferase-isomerase
LNFLSALPQGVVLGYNGHVKLRDFSFELPPERIARFPSPDRDGSRLMVVERKTGNISHHGFRDIPGLLDADEFLVINNSRVVPARLFGRVGNSDIEVLMVYWHTEKKAEVLAMPAKRLKKDVWIEFEGGMSARVCGTGARGRRFLEFDRSREEVLQTGYAPLPPYIKRKREEAFTFKDHDLSRYQTVYADAPGSIAAPTAGLHFTPQLLAEIRGKTEILEITLAVGEATFQKIEADNLEVHRMGEENVRISHGVRDRIHRLRVEKKKRLTAVGTTCVRGLETLAAAAPDGEAFTSDLFIYPGFRFRMVDRMVTNFHLPESSLFVLVSAFAGLDLMKEAYRIAVAEGYRFFSYGDAMYIR